jgi:hypothetical protein
MFSRKPKSFRWLARPLAGGIRWGVRAAEHGHAHLFAPAQPDHAVRGRNLSREIEFSLE